MENRRCSLCGELEESCACVTDRKLKEEFALWLARGFQVTPGYKTVFGTLTLRNRADGSAPGRQMGRRRLDTWFEAVEPYVSRLIAVEEFGSAFGRLHYHALAMLPEKGMSITLSDSWNGGFTKFEEVRKLESALRYVSKYAAKDYGEGPYFKYYVDSTVAVEGKLDGF